MFVPDNLIQSIIIKHSSLLDKFVNSKNVLRIQPLKAFKVMPRIYDAAEDKNTLFFSCVGGTTFYLMPFCQLAQNAITLIAVSSMDNRHFSQFSDEFT